MTKVELRGLLKKHHKKIRRKIINDILRRIEQGEVRVAEVKGSLVLLSRTSIVDVKHRWENGFISRLIQRGRTKHGKSEAYHKFDGIGKKLLFGEEPIVAARRCLIEKLHLKNFRLRPLKGPSWVITFDRRFGCIPIVMEKHFFECFIPKSKFRPNGFTKTRINRRGSEVTYDFQWVPELSNISDPRRVVRLFKIHD